MGIRFALVVVIGFCWHGTALAGSQMTRSAKEVAQELAGIHEIEDVAMAPSGKWVTYVLVEPSVGQNKRVKRRFLQHISPSVEYLDPPMTLSIPDNAVGVQWHPRNACLSMVVRKRPYAWDSVPVWQPDGGVDNDASFVCYNIMTGEVEPIITKGKSVSENYKWSPSGNYVAYIAPIKRQAALDPRRGVPHGLLAPGYRYALFLLDIKSGDTTQITPDNVNVTRYPNGNFDWSPDERSLVVAVEDEVLGWGFDSDLVLVDLKSKGIRTLVARAGMDAHPCWSPSGKKIAFLTQQNDAAYRGGWPGMVDLISGRITDFPKDVPMQDHLARSNCRWSPDSSVFFYVAAHKMLQPIIRADPSTRSVEVLSQSSDLHLGYEGSRSFDATGRRFSFVLESPVTPPDLFVSEIDCEKCSHKLTRLTNFGADYAFSKNVYVEEVSWPSADGEFTIHGQLLRPKISQSNISLERLPAVLYFMGGPTMLQHRFSPGGWSGGPSLALAERGYAVLIPNTRGRGGYGVQFWDAIRHGKNRARAPLADGLAGLDQLIASGVVDPRRTAVIGHSYGGYLTAYAITHTSRFKASVIHEGASYFLLNSSTFGPADGYQAILKRDLVGVHDPFDPNELARLIDESPGMHMNHVRTPTLLLSAARSGPYGPYQASTPSVLEQLPIYRMLRRFNVPAALLVYDELHSFRRPAAIADDLTRTAEWLDYWVRSMPFPDSDRAKEYGQEEWGSKKRDRLE